MSLEQQGMLDPLNPIHRMDKLFYTSSFVDSENTGDQAAGSASGQQRREFFKLFIPPKQESDLVGNNEPDVASNIFSNFLSGMKSGMEGHSMSRRDLSKGTLAAGLAGVIGSGITGKLVNTLGRSVVENKPSDETVNTVVEEGMAVVQEKLSKLGIIQDVENGLGNFNFQNTELLSILDDVSVSESDNPEEEIMNQIEGVLGWVEKNFGKESTEVAIDIGGSIIAFRGIKNILDPEIGHITKPDYARIMAWSAFSYMVGNDERKLELQHNTVETVVASATILALTEASDLAIVGRKKQIEQFMRVAGLDGVSVDDFGDYMNELRLNNPDEYFMHMKTASDFAPDHEAFSELLLGSTLAESDLAEILSSIDFELQNNGNVDKLRILFAINGLNPVLTSIVAPSVFQSFVREIATDEEGSPDFDVISAMQGFLPNSLAMWAPPQLYVPLSKLLKDIPVIRDLVLGADYGPRLAISQLGGEHGVEALSLLDDPYNLISQVLSNANFAGEMCALIAKKEGRPATSVLKELVDPTKWKGTKELLSNFTAKSNLQDATLGRVSRGWQVLSHAIDSHLPTEEDFQPYPDMQQQEEFTLSDKFRNLREVVAKATDFEHWGHAIGHEIVDIATTLPFQSLCVPYIQGLFGSILNIVEQSEIGSENPKAKEQGIDIIQNSIFGLMSSTFDNFAACKASVGISIQRMHESVQNGLYKTEADINKRFMAMVAKNYASSVDGGGLLPPGNMPNLKLFSLDYYSLANALKPSRLFKRSIPLALHYVQHAATEKLGLFNSRFSFKWFDKAKGEH